MECRKKYTRPIGAWFTQIGPLHTVHQLWKYEDLGNRKELREAAWQENEWSSTVTKTASLTEKMETRTMKFIA